MAQFEKTMLDVRRTCGAKAKVSEELIDGNRKNLIISICDFVIFLRLRIKEGKFRRGKQGPEVLYILCRTDEWNIIEEK